MREERREGLQEGEAKVGKGLPIDHVVLDHLNSKSVPQAPPTNHTHKLYHIMFTCTYLYNYLKLRPHG